MPFAFTKEGIFYFTRRVPSDLRSHYATERISFSLRTRSAHQAIARANAYATKLDEFWLHLRMGSAETPGQHMLRSEVERSLPPSSTLTQAVELYVQAKGRNRSATFFRAARRAGEYLVAVRGDKPLLEYTKSDATAFRDALFARGLSSASVVRVFSNLRAVVGFALSEQGHQAPNPFASIYIDRGVGVSEREAFSIEEVRTIQQQCRKLDDDLRWLIALISDTGMRLAEAAGLSIDDIDLSSAVPHVIVRPHPWRSLKTKDSERKIPLAGESLWAAGRICSMTAGRFAFPRYTTDQLTNANSASAALNKWLKSVVPGAGVVHSFRHSLRDRLRAVECPSDIVDQLGGWTTAGEGQGYGQGYPIEVLGRWMLSITTLKNGATTSVRLPSPT